VPAILAIQDSYTPHVKAFADFLRRDGRGLTMPAVRDHLAERNGSRHSAGSIRVKRQACIRRVRQAFAGSSLDDKARHDPSRTRLDGERLRAGTPYLVQARVNRRPAGADRRQPGDRPRGYLTQESTEELLAREHDAGLEDACAAIRRLRDEAR